jgi:hypothetical protein
MRSSHRPSKQWPLHREKDAQQETLVPAPGTAAHELSQNQAPSPKGCLQDDQRKDGSAELGHDQAVWAGCSPKIEAPAPAGPVYKSRINVFPVPDVGNDRSPRRHTAIVSIQQPEDKQLNELSRLSADGSLQASQCKKMAAIARQLEGDALN